MYGTAPKTNPWSEDPEQLTGVAVSRLAKLAALIERNRRTLPRAATKLSLDTKAVVTALQENDAVYRSNRRLFVQQIPAFIGLVNAFIKATDSADGSPEVKKVIAELTKDIEAAAMHLNAEFATISQETVVTGAREAHLDWAVLPGLTRQVSEVVEQAGRSSISAFRKFSDLAEGTVSGAAGDAMLIISSVTSQSAARVNAAGKLARIAGTTALTTIRERTIDRAVLYGNAAVKTVWATGGLAIIVGLVTLVIFAPAAPFAAGLMVYSAPNAFADIFNADMSEAKRKHELRNAGASEDLIAAWAELKGQRMIRVDTPHLSAEMDVVEKQIDGTVLAGRYAGQRLSQLDMEVVTLLEQHAPDNETRKLLQQYLDSQKTNEVVDTPSSREDVSPNLGLVGLGIEALLLGATI